MLMPKVSVLIPTYNYGRFVGQAVRSVLEQSYPNIEIIVIDDGSTDNTREILRPWQPSICYYYKTNGGTASALNFGIMKASGKYICWLSSDDIFLPDKVAKQVMQMEANPELGFSYTSFMFIDAQGNKERDIHSPFYPDGQEMVEKLMEGCFINGSSVIIRASALETVGLFDEEMGPAHDYDLWFRLLRQYPCGFLDEILIGYRWHDSNGSLFVRPNSELPVLKRAKWLFSEQFSLN